MLSIAYDQPSARNVGLTRSDVALSMMAYTGGVPIGTYYDGINKHHTNVGDYSFIGSGSNIIAPVEVGDHSYIAAGSTITNDVESHDMAIARSRQVNKKGYYDRYPVAKAAAETEKNEKK